MSSSYLLNLKINSIQSELDALSIYTGYTYTLTATGGGLIDGNSFEAPNANNTAYAVSSVARKDPWTITFTVENVSTNNVFVGVSQDPSKVFPSSSSPSMQMVDFGLLVDRNGGNTGLIEIINGQTNNIAYQLGTTYKMTYNGTAVSVFVNNIQLYSYIVELNPVYLIVGSFYGGRVDSIVFEGSNTGGGGGTLNLQQVLDNGDDGGNLSITNLNNLTLNGYNQFGNSSEEYFYRVSTTGNNFDFVQYQNGVQIATPFSIRNGTNHLNQTQFNNGALFYGGLSVLQNQQIRLTTNTNEEIKIYGSPASNQFNLIHANNSLITTDLLTINKDTMTYTFGNQEIANPSIPTLKVQGVANDTAFEGIVLDSVINPPNSFISSVLSNQTSKNVSSGSPTSIMKIDIGAYNYFNAFSSILSSFSFQNNIVSANPGVSITALFYLSDTLDGDVDDSTPLYVGFTTGNINPSGGNPNVSQNKVILSNIFNDAADIVYLNVKITSANPCVCSFSNFNINMSTQAEVNYKLTIAPSML